MVQKSLNTKLSQSTIKGLIVASIAAVILSGFFSYCASRQRLVSQWEKKNQDIHKSLESYEKNIELQAVSSLHAVENFLYERGSIQETLNFAREKLSLDGIFLIDADGKHHMFSHGSCFQSLPNTKHWHDFNLLSIDPSYKRMQANPSFKTIESTPIKWLFECSPSKIIFGWSSKINKYIEVYYSVSSFENILGNLKTSSSAREISISNPSQSIIATTNPNLDIQNHKLPTIPLGESKTTSGLWETSIISSPAKAFNTKDTYSDQEDKSQDEDYFYSVISVFNNYEIIADALMIFWVTMLVLIIMAAIIYYHNRKFITELIEKITSFSEAIKSQRGNNYIHEESLDELDNLRKNFDDLDRQTKDLQKKSTEQLNFSAGIVSSARMILHGLKSDIYRVKTEDAEEIRHIEYKIASVIDDFDQFESGFHDSVSLAYESVYKSVISLQIEYKHINVFFPLNLTHVFIGLDCNSMASIIENCISNSIEANASKIDFKAQQKEEFLHLTVVDNGTPFPEDFSIENHVKDKDKYECNNGVGLKETKKIVSSVGGSFTIDTQSKEVKIVIPIVNAPAWYLKEIDLKNTKTIVVVDDDENHFKYLQKLLPEYRFIYYRSAEKFKSNFHSVEKNTLYLIDFLYVNENVNGIDIIETLDIANHSILCTGSVFKRIRKDFPNIKIFPKSLLKETSFINKVNKK